MEVNKSFGCGMTQAHEPGTVFLPMHHSIGEMFSWRCSGRRMNTLEKTEAVLI